MEYARVDDEGTAEGGAEMELTFHAHGTAMELEQQAAQHRDLPAPRPRARRAPPQVAHRPITRSLTLAARMAAQAAQYQAAASLIPAVIIHQIQTPAQRHIHRLKNPRRPQTASARKNARRARHVSSSPQHHQQRRARAPPRGGRRQKKSSRYPHTSHSISTPVHHVQPFAPSPLLHHTSAMHTSENRQHPALTSRHRRHQRRQALLSPHQQHHYGTQASPQTSQHHGITAANSPGKNHTIPSPSPSPSPSPYQVFSKQQQRKAFVQKVLPNRSPTGFSPPSLHQHSVQAQSPGNDRSPSSQSRGSENVYILHNGGNASPWSPSHLAAHGLVPSANSHKRAHPATNKPEQHISKVMRGYQQDKTSDSIQGNSSLQQALHDGSHHTHRSPSPPGPMPMETAQQPQAQAIHKVVDYSDQTFYGQALPHTSSIIPGLSTSPPDQQMHKTPQTRSPNYNIMTHGYAAHYFPSSSPPYPPQLQASLAYIPQQRSVVQEPQHPNMGFVNMQQETQNLNTFSSSERAPPSPSFCSKLSPSALRQLNQRDATNGHHEVSHSNIGSINSSPPRQPSSSLPSPQQLSSMPTSTSASSPSSTSRPPFDRTPGLQYMHP